jgi:FtsX-like permease family
MIPLGLRLAIGGGREAITRLVVLAVAVGLGVGLLLTAVATTNAVTAWNNRHAWYWTGTAWVPPGPATGAAPLWWHPGNDIFGGRTISRFDVAATGASSPVPPGITHDPAPGQYYASPALAALLRATPANQLADRYPGHLAGTIGEAALPSPDSLVIVVGRTPAQLAHTPDSMPVTSISTTEVGWPVPPTEANPKGLTSTPADTGGGQSSIDLILTVVALAILAPVLIFIGTATRLSAARREERFATMRLVGATRRQVSLLAATESTAAAILGVAVGFGIFFLLRIPVAGIPFIGQPFFPAELTLSLSDVLVVAIGVPVAAVVAARLALRQVHISPLGVARRATPAPPRAWRVVPLLAGLAELGFWTVHGHPASIPGQIQAFASSFLLIIVGLFIAGPWLTMAAARGMARWTSRPGTLIAARRLADDPRAAFRAVSGLVLALFITTVAVVAIGTQDAKNLTRFASAAEANVLTDQLSVSGQGPTDGRPGAPGGRVGRAGPGASGQGGGNGPGAPGEAAGAARPGPAAPIAPLTARLDGIHGVQGVLVVRADPRLTIPGTFQEHGFNRYSNGPVPAGVVSCAQLATVPALGRCPAGAATAAFPSDGFDGPLFGADATAITWPAANVPATKLDALSVDAIDVGTDGSASAVEQARTVLENAHAYPAVSSLSTVGDIVAQDNTKNNDYQQLANVVILVSLPIAGCTLAAGIAAGLADRKRPFSLLRLTGARLATLRRVVALEGAVPLLAVAVVAIGAGFAGAAMFASEAQQHPMVAPGAAYYLLVGGGIAVSLGIIAATFPLLARITGPEVARNE